MTVRSARTWQAHIQRSVNSGATVTLLQSLPRFSEPAQVSFNFGSSSLLVDISPPRKPSWHLPASPLGRYTPFFCLFIHDPLTHRDTPTPPMPCFLLGTSSLRRSFSFPHLAIPTLLVSEERGKGVGSGNKHGRRGREKGWRHFVVCFLVR